MKWFKTGKIEGAKQEASGTILIDDNVPHNTEEVVLCGKVLVDKSMLETLLNKIEERLTRLENILNGQSDGKKTAW
ncbi:MAG: hypothetical protein KGJ07_09995 [Patescibacteria group bacterium]|nr:hypothetical protein [Patescibacteria group bacterium]